LINKSNSAARAHNATQINSKRARMWTQDKIGAFAPQNYWRSPLFTRIVGRSP
jgi:hypothetical protein